MPKEANWKTLAALGVAAGAMLRFSQNLPSYGFKLPTEEDNGLIGPPEPPAPPPAGFPPGSQVEYIPIGKTRWSDALRGMTSGPLVSGDKVSRNPDLNYYYIAGYGAVNDAYVRMWRGGLTR